MFINGKEYEWAEVGVVMGGRDVIGIQGINYGQTKTLTHLYAKGGMPHAIQGGNVAVSGEITVTQSELQGLEKAGRGSIFNLNMDITVMYGNPSRGDAISIDVIQGVKFSEQKKGMAQGDANMSVTIPFLALRVIPG